MIICYTTANLKFGLNSMNGKVKKHPKASEEFDETEVAVERIVPISNVEILGISMKSDDSSVLLELGYIKNQKNGDVVIDVRKEMPLEMAEDLYLNLKNIFDKPSTEK